MRTFCCLIARNVFSVLQVFSKLERYDYTERLIEEGKISNLELVEDIYPTAKILLQLMLCARFMLLLAVFKWRRLVKYSYYLDITVQMVETLLPIGFEFGHELLWQMMMQYIIFFLSYFNFWPSFAYSLFSLIPVFAFRIAFYQEPLGTVLIGLIYIPWSCLNMFIMHWVITKMGFLYVEAEVLRSGNDQLLDNLEEGVIIVEETTNDILYYNNAAAGSRRGALPMESDAEIAFDLSKKPDLTTMIAE